ncbi:Xaa-Pro aminopeptidase [Fictibacillus enclensis]|uniref:Xaa-Pro aminopeptidase n=1 Tax=Fictibacillus enclensis TaxID=1017270 RepID=A0A0V8JAV6_9BACL|nr:aminopeptidase P family protein [Fictibacillus enclensis]KSU84065.1 Xaa-Pro dipeptidase [Fictibacillus enclensis]SCB72567.1 Xaa-Pro aminopeptidase [Fictibacillus enclensis]
MKPSFYAENRKKLAAQLPNESTAVLFAGEAPYKSADERYPFTPNRNFYYNTGIDGPNVILVIKKTAGTVEETLFIEKPDPVMEKWVGVTISQEEAKAVSGIGQVQYLENFESSMGRTLFTEQVQTVFLDLEQREFKGWQSKASLFAKHLQEHYPQVAIRNAYPIITELRVFKTAEEIEKIKEAIQITKDGIYNVMKHAGSGMLENELEAHFNFVLKTAGVKDFAFHTILASGKNATVLHYENNDSHIEKDSLILLDLGAQKDYYNADISFTFPADGKFTERQKQFYNIVLKALRETTSLIKPGLKFAELNERTKAILAEECMKIGLIKETSEISNYYYHGVSHFLGLDTHDVGSYKNRVLEPGMVLTIEPGLYIAEEAIGIRIEDDILVTEDGYENLSADIIRTTDEIEAFMSDR